MSLPTEIDWERRERHRVSGFDAICRSKEFQARKLILDSESFTAYLRTHDPARLAAVLHLERPSPWDKSLNKRAWEKAVQVWREELRRLTEFKL